MGRGSGGKVQRGAENKTCPSFRDGPQHQTSDAQLRVGESKDSGFASEPVIGPRFARTHWTRSGMTNGED
jgi:hypothetical protein